MLARHAPKHDDSALALQANNSQGGTYLRIVITGGGGFLGRKIATLLARVPRVVTAGVPNRRPLA